MKTILDHPFPGATPILDVEQAAALEKQVLGDDEALVEDAVEDVGEALAAALLRDYRECQRPERPWRFLLLAGKGHNGADALAAACALARRGALEEVLVLATQEAFKPLTQNKLNALEGLMGEALQIKRVGPEVSASTLEAELLDYSGSEGFDVCLDGLLGTSSKGVLRAPLQALVTAVNEYGPIGLRAAVDIPTGLGDLFAFRADFTYTVGSAKAPLFGAQAVSCVGRVRFLDIGFFENAGAFWSPEGHASWLLSAKSLRPLWELRESVSYKRTYGHLVIVAGSRGFAGAAMMAAHAALLSGVGLVTACVPESLVASFAAVLPEVMWAPWPEVEGGCLDPKGFEAILSPYLERATATLIGPGVGRNPAFQAAVEAYAAGALLPGVFDADALQSSLLNALRERPAKAGAVILTPHTGEYERLIENQEDKNPEHLARRFRAVLVRKGSSTALHGAYYTYISTLGGPVLARGGSGDILAGIIAGLLAQFPTAPLQAAALGTLWHGYAADRLAEARGHRSVRITELFDYL